ncbi:hypothetical protein IE53DRAFT_114105 [Violaceomyces palustris]|uniref:Uncharacterized protein n=1 Tax=Violaceomyces palustris TaxID=1673888 RepID=A0ACD0NWC0_9BASI|nr:hypothetical protein IE53DRAFT_114105 [Violaceomyces palustris]
MSDAQAFNFLSRPRLSHRSISDLSPLVESHSFEGDSNGWPGQEHGHGNGMSNRSGSRLRGMKIASGGLTTTGSRLPFSPLLPMPPARCGTEEEMMDLANCDGGDSTPKPLTSETVSSLASRRQARRVASENTVPDRRASANDHLAVNPKVLRVDTRAASVRACINMPRSAGMIRSYSMPVATQVEYEAQKRIMALGSSCPDSSSGLGAYSANTSWWSYGWPASGGGTPRLERRPSISVPPLEAVTMLSSPSPKSKVRQLSPRLMPRSPRAGRSPLGLMSTNLPAREQQQPSPRASLSKSGKPSGPEGDVPFDDTARFDMEIVDQELEVIHEKNENWSGGGHFTDCGEDDYFSVRKDSTGTSDAGSDEARTPRASSPSLPMRSNASQSMSLGLDLGRHDGGKSQANAVIEDDEVFGDFSFIHPDHLAPPSPFPIF